MTGPYRGLSSLTDPTVTVILDPQGQGTHQVFVMCQARIGSVVSECSEQVNIFIDYSPYPIYAPLKNNDKKQEQQRIDKTQESESI